MASLPQHEMLTDVRFGSNPVLVAVLRRVRLAAVSGLHVGVAIGRRCAKRRRRAICWVVRGLPCTLPDRCRVAADWSFRNKRSIGILGAAAWD